MTRKELVIINELITTIAQESEEHCNLLKWQYEKIDTLEESKKLEHTKEYLIYAIKFITRSWGISLEIQKIIYKQFNGEMTPEALGYKITTKRNPFK